MRIKEKYRAIFIIDPETFIRGLKPVLSFNFGIDEEPPTDNAARAVYDALMSDLKYDLERTAQIRANEQKRRLKFGGRA